jgi:hypothetical protein
MSIDGAFLETLIENLQAKVVVGAGKPYSTAALHNLPLPIEPPFPSISLATLDSIVDYIQANRDKIEINEAQILCGAQNVALISAPNGENRKRDDLVNVRFQPRDLMLNTYLDIELFRLQLFTQYSDSEGKKKILEFIAKIADSNIVTAEDDGVTQSVTAKVGIASFGEVKIPSPIILQPIRTFHEVNQPEGWFIFRMKKPDKPGLPLAGLFEIETGWQRIAAIEVMEYLKIKLPDMTILA